MLTDAATMAKQKNDFEWVQKERVNVARALADVDRRRAELEQRASELAITARTLAQRHGIALEDNGEITNGRGRSGGKPRKIPSIYQMATVLLQESGQEWLEGREIIRLIRERWWPTADRRDIAPTLWRLYNTRKLRKNGTCYALPETQEPSSAPAPNGS